MKKMSLIMMMVALWFVAACGTKETTSNPEPSATAVNAVTEKSGGTIVEEIKKRGKLTIATTGTFRPITFMNEKGELDGVDIEIGKLIADKLGVKAEFIPGNLAGLIPGMIDGKFDLVMSGTTKTAEREKIINFSETYLSLGTIAVVKEANTSVKDVTKLEGLVVGVISGSGTQKVITELGGYKKLVEYPGHAEAIMDLKAGRIDVYAAGSIAANDYIRNDKSGDPVKVVGNVYKKLEIGVGMRKGEDELKEIIDSLIQEKKKDGTIAKIMEKWIGEQKS
jgi:ABC-type amino acid transport substrate-binding protein